MIASYSKWQFHESWSYDSAKSFFLEMILKRAILSSFAVVAAGIAVLASGLINPTTATAATYQATADAFGNSSSAAVSTSGNSITASATNGQNTSTLTATAATTTTAAAQGACGDKKGFGESIRARRANFVGDVRTFHKVVGDMCIEVYIGKTDENTGPVIWGGNCVALNNKPARAVSAQLSYYVGNHRVADVESEKNRRLWIPGTYKLHNETNQPDSIYSKTGIVKVLVKLPSL